MKKASHKFLLGVICIVIIVLIPFSLWLLSFGNKIQQLPGSNLAVYQTPSYSFYYPKNWQISKSEMTNIKGASFFLQPPNSVPPKTPHVTIEVADANQASMSDMTEEFTIFKYSKTNTVVNGMNAQKYTNIVPSSEGVLHSIAYVFEAKGNIYLVKLGYKQEITDSQLEEKFSQIVTSFIFH